MLKGQVRVFPQRAILSLSKTTRATQDPADQFARHYRCTTNIEIRGHVLLESGQRCFLPAWHSVAELDHELDLLGLGTPGDEAFSWVAPTGAGALRLSELREANE